MGNEKRHREEMPPGVGGNAAILSGAGFRGIDSLGMNVFLKNKHPNLS
jgi:hypothetical protein